MHRLLNGKSISLAVTIAAMLLSAAAIAQTRVLPTRPIVLRPLCPEPAGGGTVHNTTVGAGNNEYWGEKNGPHVVGFDISIYGTVTIDGCTVVQIAAGRTISVYPGGTLQVLGTRLGPNIGSVLIGRVPNGGAWGRIRNLGGVISMSHASISGGGATQAANPTPAILADAAMIEMRSTNTKTAFHLDNVVLGDSASQGILVASDTGFDATSENLTIRNSVYYPLQVYASVLGSVPSGNYAENRYAAIAIRSNGPPVKTSQTLRNRGVPYHVGSSNQDGGRLDVNSQVANSVATLTIEPGVMLQFPPGGALRVEPNLLSNTAARGALIAVGTPTVPILFTSDRGPAAAPGDWAGVSFGGIINPATVVRYGIVYYAGGPSAASNSCPNAGLANNNAAIRIYGPTLSQFITDTTIAGSAQDGIDRGWRSDVQPDFLASNTITSFAQCKQSTPRTAAGVCPMPVPCPK